ncbi:hypothetical protein [Dysgonomonas sp. BGC7]|uniref:hypothetical protein n=1 Tax=Dysgonomonas sp. BGC7 TaxID=1658008 RepID=UPI00067FFF7A|nr:hypothetical protein [Dysgonomonas sp. BGC7]MBD8387938.1 hypothetical protein [Dysgonomonas sp. BGC7]
MIYRLIILIGFFFLLTGKANAQLDKPTLKVIYKQQKNKNDILGVANRFDFARQELNKLDSLSFINQKMDTVYLLETYDMETGISYGSIWNKCKRLNYTYYHGGVLEFKADDFFARYMRALVSAWDIDAIRKEEKRGSKPISPNDIYATRIIIGKKTKIDFFTFNEFSDLWIDASE